MFRIIPREKVFFDLFEKAAENARRGAEEVHAVFERFDDIAERAKRMKDIEHVGDELTHEMIDRLNQTFITPIDREDIHELAVRLDDIVDLMDTAVNRVLLYKIDKPIDESLALAQCLVHSTRVICEMLPLMRLMSAKNADVIRQKCRDVHTQENEGDRIEQHALAALFDGKHDPLYVMKWKNVIEELESATDRCEDVANVIEGIVLKNA